MHFKRFMRIYELLKQMSLSRLKCKCIEFEMNWCSIHFVYGALDLPFTQTVCNRSESSMVHVHSWGHLFIPVIVLGSRITRHRINHLHDII